MTEHKQRNNDSKIACILNQNYQGPQLSVADSRIRFAIPQRVGSHNAPLTHQRRSVSQREAIHLGGLGAPGLLAENGMSALL